MNKEFSIPENLSKKENAQLILDFFHRTMMHHAMWFAEVQKYLGKEDAFIALDEAWKNSSSIQMKRIAKSLGFEIEDNIPKPLLDLPEETLTKLRDGMAVNWLANDGVMVSGCGIHQGNEGC